jgi:hypothetical protein
VSKYRNDPRVRQAGRGWTVRNGSREYQVLHTALGWGVFTGWRQTAAYVAGGRPAIGYRSADDAIAAVIGDPR